MPLRFKAICTLKTAVLALPVKSLYIVYQQLNQEILKAQKLLYIYFYIQTSKQHWLNHAFSAQIQIGLASIFQQLLSASKSTMKGKNLESLSSNSSSIKQLQHTGAAQAKLSSTNTNIQIFYVTNYQCQFIKMRILQFCYFYTLQIDCQFTMYKLFTGKVSSAVLRVRIALNLKGIPFHYCDFQHLSWQEGREQLKGSGLQIQIIKRNVPILVLPYEQHLQESLPIIQYLNNAHPSPYNLFPGNEIQKAKIKGFCSAIDTRVYPFLNQDNEFQTTNYIQKYDKYSYDSFYEETFEGCLKNIQELIEQNSKEGPFIFGKEITAADIFFYPQILAANNFSPKGLEKDKKQKYPSYKGVCRIFESLKEIKQFSQQKI